MRTIRNSFGSLAIIGGLIGSLNFIQAAGTSKPVQSVSAGSMDVLSVLDQARALAASEPVLEQSIPVTATGPSADRPAGTYWSLVANTQPPMPFDPFPELPVYTIDPADRIFVVDDRSVNFLGLRAQQEEQAQMRAMAGTRMDMDVPSPGDGGDGGTNSYMSNESSFVLPDWGTNLWVRLDGIVSNNLVGIISNSTPVQLELQYKTDLLQTGWVSSGWFVYGSEATNWTAWSVPMISPSNLFVRIRSWETDGSGLPIWWQMQYFGYVGVDPYGNPAGDGWNNLQKFQNGMNPNVFYTPPAPQLNVSYNAFSGMAAVSWMPLLTPATGYTVERFDVYYIYVQTNIFNLSASTDNLADSVPVPYGSSWGGWQNQQIYAYYRVQAHYATGDSAWSAPAYARPDSFASVSLVPGPEGSAYLAVASLPLGTTALRLTRIAQSAGNTSIDIPVSASTNGLYLATGIHHNLSNGG